MMVEHVITPAVQHLLDTGAMRLCPPEDKPVRKSLSELLKLADKIGAVSKPEESTTMTFVDPDAAWNAAVNKLAADERISPDMAAIELASNPRYSHIAKAAYAAGEQARTINALNAKKVYG